MTYIIAHRGASYDAPENTLAAFSLAWQQQADGIEGDYCYTSDREVGCIHDDSTQRTGNVNLPVASSAWDQLCKIDVGVWKSSNYAGERIPRFAEVLDSTPPDKWCVIELKTGPEIVQLVKSLLLSSKFDHSKLLIIAFDARTIAESKRQLPHVKAHWLVDYKFESTSGWLPTAAKIAEVVKQCRADGIGSQALRKVVTADFINQLRQAGVSEFHLWTVDDPDDAIYYRELGAWGITTNRPKFIRQALEDRGL